MSDLGHCAYCGREMKVGENLIGWGPNIVHVECVPPKQETFAGMSLRDWFAGQALAGLCVSDKFVNDQFSNESTAKWAYRLADAMLAARKSHPSP